MPGGTNVKFLKMEGLGNDFVVFEGPRDVSAAQVEAWCDRRWGIGADGVLVVTPLGGNRVRMEYWNADGSPAEMCGNGLRCVARLAYDRGWVDEDVFTVITAVGAREARMGPEVTVQVGVPEGEDVSLELAGLVARPINLGNPHAVVFVDDPGGVSVGEVGRRLGTDQLFPEGSNIEFAAVRSPELLELRVGARRRRNVGLRERRRRGRRGCSQVGKGRKGHQSPAARRRAVGDSGRARCLVDRPGQLRFRGGVACPNLMDANGLS